MAKSQFEYVKQFEPDDNCLRNCWIVVRIDGKRFHKFSDRHNFVKPNDDRALQLMNRCAEQVLQDFRDIIIAYGQSDEYSFVFKKNCSTYNRRASKLMSTLVSLFASSYVYHWGDFMGDMKLQYPPAFDSRVVLYPSTQNVRDYLSWRQDECHINNLHNTVFWAMVQQGGLTNREAHDLLSGTLSGEKNEILFSQFNINYNDLPELYRKGSIIYKVKEETEGPVEYEDPASGEKREKVIKKSVTKDVMAHVDIIGEAFWRENAHLLMSTDR